MDNTRFYAVFGGIDADGNIIVNFVPADVFEKEHPELFINNTAKEE